ncbi:PIN domain-containing protein [Thiorhodospira sibirica]|uniref:PIN domain-containing protein n=1 Tax=Thiorhodospira sibirica TaxID=154347 RepID=UPI00022C1116|nr:PIN domain-containing protein [Thiorhodospira sibirica]
MSDDNPDQKNNADTTNHPRVLLVDLENCPTQFTQLAQRFDDFTKILICYANPSVKLPIDLLIPLSKAIAEHRLTLHKMEAIGKNAADFGITFLAGMLAMQLPPDTEFWILSNDKDLDHVITLLGQHQRQAQRISNLERETPFTPSNQEPSTDPDPLIVYCQHLSNYSKNRPAKEQTLRNSIKAKLPKQSDAVHQALLQKLQTVGAIHIKDQKVSYCETKIRTIATQGMS